MGRTAQFDFFYGRQADQYTFYRIPKVLFTDEYFKNLSCEAKVLYGLMLDRMSLSIKNKWFDEEGKVYIVFSVEDVMELMNCGNQKAVRCLAELDGKKGIGLIEKKRMGLGKASIIYVKNFILSEIEEIPEDDFIEEIIAETLENTQKCENHTSRNVKTTLQEVRKSHFKKCENHTSRNVKITPQEVLNSHTNYNNINYTDSSDTESNLSIVSTPVADEKSDSISEQIDMMDEIETYRTIIKENIEYDSLCNNYRPDEVDGLIEIMLEILITDRKEITISGQRVPVAMVKSRFMKMNYEHMQYIFESLKRNTTKVGNIKSYLLATLYNAPVTIGHYYGAEANYDMHGMKA